MLATSSTIRRLPALCVLLDSSAAMAAIGNARSSGERDRLASVVRYESESVGVVQLRNENELVKR